MTTSKTKWITMLNSKGILKANYGPKKVNIITDVTNQSVFNQ